MDQVGIHDNFFDLGGHSLLAAKILSSMHDLFQVQMELRVLFDHPTIEELALTITENLAAKVSSI